MVSQRMRGRVRTAILWGMAAVLYSYTIPVFAQKIIDPGMDDPLSGRILKQLTPETLPTYLQEREAAYTKLIALDATQWLPFYHRGFVRMVQRKWEESLADYTQSLALNPKNPECLMERGLVYRQQGKNMEALKDWDEAIRLGSVNPEVFAERGLLRLQMGNREAVNDLQRAIALGTQNSRVHYLHGVIQYGMGNYAQTIADMTETLKRVNHYAPALLYRGRARMDQNQYKQAIADFSEALKHLKPEPDNTQTRELLHYFRGSAYLKRLKLVPALSDMEQAIVLDAKDSDAYIARAMIYALMERPVEARKDLDIAWRLALDEGDAEKVERVTQRTQYVEDALKAMEAEAARTKKPIPSGTR
jgi:tetratricopeptide (TPR) repeat protein